jgi:steroid delta-isomerase-like uncharacterized protein
MTTRDDAGDPVTAVRHYWREIWSDGRFELAARFYAPRYRENLDESTPEEFAEGAAAWRAHFSDFRVDVDDIFIAGHRVVSRVTYRATHTGDFRRVPALGRTCEVPGIDIFEFEDGRVIQHWHATDHLELFRQLGAELGPAAAADRP